MWSSVQSLLQNRKAGLSIARVMLEHGIRIDHSGRFFVGDVAISDSSLARAAGVDRRAVRETAGYILSKAELKAVLSKIRPFGASLAEVASLLRFSVLRIHAEPHAPGVISDVSSVLAGHNIVIRQALADDPDLVPEPRLTLVVEGDLPASALEEIRALDCVRSLTLTK
ncbi:MAG: ACT domain-containing protein [Nitrososphaerota archaeon]|nr:ACT domain-containing protein [Nitrososphaerota archaeon]MDG6939409.1 ACT domain-containing protein [Nitrososphaerota archaeon]